MKNCDDVDSFVGVSSMCVVSGILMCLKVFVAQNLYAEFSPIHIESILMCRSEQLNYFIRLCNNCKQLQTLM